MKFNNKELKVHSLDVKEDERGWLAEILRNEDGPGLDRFGQLFITTANPGMVKGNHYHTRKYEWFCVTRGEGMLYIENTGNGLRDEIPMGENNFVCVRIPPNHTHAIRNVGKNPLDLLVYISETYNPCDPDTFPKKIA